MVRLEKFTENDFDRLLGWIDSEELLLQFAGSVFKFPLDKKQLSDYIKSPSRQIFKIVTADTNEAIGHAEIGSINKENSSASLCRLLIGDKTRRGKGIGYLVVKKLLEICFNDLCLHRVELWVYDYNESAINCYKKAGFKTDGLARDAHKVKNKYWSAFLMSILRPEWEQLYRK